MSTRTSKIKRALLWGLIAIAGIVFVAIAAALLTYPADYVYRIFVWGESDAFDWQKFPYHELEPAPTPFTFEESSDERVAQLLEGLAEVDNLGSYLEQNQTQAFIVIQDGVVLYEGYFNNTQRDSMVTSFSVAKSFTSALIGIAIDEGFINAVDDPITRYLPELADRDPRFDDITIHDLLMMSSGLEYKEFRFPGPNSDDALTSYYPDQRWIALNNTRIVDRPGDYFQYNKYHPQLLGMILERATGSTVTRYLQTKIWNPLGMEYGGSWSTDSERSDFEKMETGVNARAIDFAKFGQLYLNGGTWNDKQVISAEWVKESTEPYLPVDYESYYPDEFANLPRRAYYRYMWWGIARPEGGYDFSGEGDKGQFIYVSPGKRLVVVRNGIDYGIPFESWFKLIYQFASDF